MGRVIFKADLGVKITPRFSDTLLGTDSFLLGGGDYSMVKVNYTTVSTLKKKSLLMGICDNMKYFPLLLY